MKNKYGKEIDLDALRRSPGEEALTKLLDELGVKYKAQWFFDETGHRRQKYDFAVFRETDDTPAFLIEYDGAPHFDSGWYEKAGTRPERCRMHVAKQMLSDALKTQVATMHGIPVLRINPMQNAEMRSLITAWVYLFVNQGEANSLEIAAIEMFDAFGWPFEFVERSEPTKKEQAYLESRRQRLEDF